MCKVEGFGQVVSLLTYHWNNTGYHHTSEVYIRHEAASHGCLTCFLGPNLARSC